jgi:tripartite-type tricarboxylate transporter receptor subunit TctC
MSRVLAVLLAAALSAPAASMPVAASSPIRIVAGMAAGGAPDVYARAIADHMSDTLKRPVIVENKPGAGGNLAAQMVLESSADGQTLWLSTAAQSEINPSVYSKLKWKVDDFIPLVRGVEAPLVLVVNPGVPARTLAELVSWMRANRGKLSYASYSPGTPSHFLGHLLNQQFGIDLAHVPYRGSGEQIKDLVAGHTLLGFAQLQTSQTHVKSGRLFAIATTGNARTRFMPDVPTFSELQHPEFTASIWFGLMARTGTPPAVIERLVTAAKAAHSDRTVREKLESQGFEVSGRTGPELVADIKMQAEKWAKVVKAAGFTVD